MDEKDKKIADLEKSLNELRASFEAEKATLVKTIAEKDIIITQKTEDIVNQRKSYKRLVDMSEEERNAMSTKERELQERQEKFEDDQKKFQDEQKGIREKELGERRGKIIASIAGKDPELQKKTLEAFGKIKDSDLAQTEEEITTIANSAFNMLGVPRPDPVRSAINGGYGGEPGGEAPVGGFADAPGGKELGDAMGLQSAKPPVEGAK